MSNEQTAVPGERVMPIIVLNPMEVRLYAFLAFELLTKHPETGHVALTDYAKQTIPAEFVPEVAKGIQSFLNSLEQIREQAEIAQAQAESKAISKEHLN